MVFPDTSNRTSVIIPSLPTPRPLYNQNNQNKYDPKAYYTEALGFLPIDTRYLSNTTNSLAYNSMADVIFNRAAHEARWKDNPDFDWLVDIPVIGDIVRIPVDTLLLLKNTILDPVVGSVKDDGWSGLLRGLSTATINTLTNVGNSLDILSNPIKGLVLEGGDGFVKGLVGDRHGRKQYNYSDFINTGSGVADFSASMAAEIFSDPMTYLSFGISALGKTGASATAKTLGKITTETAEALTKSGAKAVTQEVVETAADNALQQTIKHSTRYVLANGDDATTVVKNVAAKYGTELPDDAAEGFLRNIVDETGVNADSLAKAQMAAVNQMNPMLKKAALDKDPNALKTLSTDLRSKSSLERAAYLVDDNNYLTPGLQNYYASLLNDTTIDPALRSAKTMQNVENIIYKGIKTPVEVSSLLGPFKLGKKGVTKLIARHKSTRAAVKMAQAVQNIDSFLNSTDNTIDFDGDIIDINVSSKIPEVSKVTKGKVVDIPPEGKVVSALPEVVDVTPKPGMGLSTVETIDVNVHRELAEAMDKVVFDFRNKLYDAPELTKDVYVALRDDCVKELDSIISKYTFGKIYPFADFTTYQKYVQRINVYGAPKWVSQLNDKLNVWTPYLAEEVNPTFLQSLHLSLNARANTVIQKAALGQVQNLYEVTEALGAIKHLNKYTASTTSTNSIALAEQRIAQLRTLIPEANSLGLEDGSVFDDIYALVPTVQDVVSAAKINRGDWYNTSIKGSNIFESEALDEAFDNFYKSYDSFLEQQNIINSIQVAYGIIKTTSPLKDTLSFLETGKPFKAVTIKIRGEAVTLSAQEVAKRFDDYIEQVSKTLTEYNIFRNVLTKDADSYMKRAIENPHLQIPYRAYIEAVDKLPALSEKTLCVAGADVNDIVDLGLTKYGMMNNKRQILSAVLKGYGTNNASGFAKLLEEYSRKNGPIYRLLHEVYSDSFEAQRIIQTFDNILQYRAADKQLSKILNKFAISDFHKQGVLDCFITKLETYSAFDERHLTQTIQDILDAGDAMVQTRFNVPKLSLDYLLWQSVHKNANASDAFVRNTAQKIAKRLNSAGAHNAAVDVQNLIDFINITPDIRKNLIKAVAGKKILVFDIETTGVKNAQIFQLSARVLNPDFTPALDAYGKELVRTYNVKVPADMMPDLSVVEKLSPGLSGDAARQWFIKNYVEGTGDVSLFANRYEMFKTFQNDFNITKDTSDYILCGHNIRQFDIPELIGNVRYNTDLKNYFQNVLNKHAYYDTYEQMLGQHMWRMDDLTRVQLSQELHKFFETSAFLQDGKAIHRVVSFKTIQDLHTLKDLFKERLPIGFNQEIESFDILCDNAAKTILDEWNIHSFYKATDDFIVTNKIFDPNELRRLVKSGKVTLPYGITEYDIGHNIMQTVNRYIVENEKIILQPYKVYSYELANSFDPKKIIEFYKKDVALGTLREGQAPISTLQKLTRASNKISNYRQGLTLDAVRKAYPAAKAFLESGNVDKFYAPFLYDIATADKELVVATAMYFVKHTQGVAGAYPELAKALSFDNLYAEQIKYNFSTNVWKRYLEGDAEVNAFIRSTKRTRTNKSRVVDEDAIAFNAERAEREAMYTARKAEREAMYTARRKQWDAESAFREQLAIERKEARAIRQKLKDKKQRQYLLDQEARVRQSVSSADEAARKIWAGELGTQEDFNRLMEANKNDPFITFKNLYEDKGLFSAVKQAKAALYSNTHTYTKAYSDLLHSVSQEEQTLIIQQLLDYDTMLTQASVNRILNQSDRVTALKAEARFTGGRVLFPTDKPVDLSDFAKDSDLVVVTIPYTFEKVKGNPIYDVVTEGTGFNIVKPKANTKTVFLNFIGVKASAYQDSVLLSKPLSKRNLDLLDKQNIKYTVETVVDETGTTQYRYYFNGAKDLKEHLLTKDAAVNIVSKDFDPRLQELLTQSSKQFSGAVTNAGFSHGDVVTSDLFYTLDRFLPQDVVDQLVPTHVLEATGFFNTLRGNNTILGNTDVQRLFNPHYASNRFNRIAYTVKYNIDTQLDSVSVFANFLCNKENGISTNEAISALTNAEIRALVKEHPDWTLLYVTTVNANAKVQTKSGLTVHRITDFSDKSLDAARKINAHFVPADTAYTLQQCFNNFELTGSLKFAQQLSSAYKLGYLGSVGTVMRNFIDSNHKNRMDLYHTFKLPKQISRFKSSFQILNKYQDIQMSYVELTGKMLTDSVDYRALYTLCTEDTDVIARLLLEESKLSKAIQRLQNYYTPEDLFKIKEHLLKPELFVLTHNFIENAPSAGLFRKIVDELSNTNPNKSLLNWVTDKTPLSILFDSNEMVEQCVRFSRYIEDLQANKSLSEAALNLINTHFDYADKSLAMLFTELVFPFMSFSFKNLNYWLETFSKNAPAVFELENVFRTVLDYHSLFNPNQEAYEAYDYTFDFKEEMEFKSQIPWQMINAARLYHLLAGNVVIAANDTITRNRGYGEEDLELYNVFKLSPSFMDAIKVLYNPLNTYQERLLPPYEVLAKLVPDILNGVQNLDSLSVSSLANMLPIVGANTQRWGLGNTNNAIQRTEDLGLHQLIPSVFGATYVPHKDKGYWYDSDYNVLGGFKQNYYGKRSYGNPYNSRNPHYTITRMSRNRKPKSIYTPSKKKRVYDYQYSSLRNSLTKSVLKSRLKDYNYYY